MGEFTPNSYSPVLPCENCRLLKRAVAITLICLVARVIQIAVDHGQVKICKKRAVGLGTEVSQILLFRYPNDPRHPTRFKFVGNTIQVGADVFVDALALGSETGS